MRKLGYLLSGILFGLGLAISDMTNPATVLGFLDITGDWNPSLIGVMVSGILVYHIAWRFSRNRKPLVLGEFFHLPAKNEIDAKLIIGAALFGAGWGLAGYCPGPMLASISSASDNLWLVLLSFLTATGLTKYTLNIRAARQMACEG